MSTLIRWMLAATFAALAGCASVKAPAPPPPNELFADEQFKPPSSPVSTANLFDLSPAMRNYLHSPRFTRLVRNEGAERGLLEALYDTGELKLDYDASITRNAADTYEARSGNCLSLVIMTAAFARALNVNVQFNDVMMDALWTRNGDMYFANTHVNMTLGRAFSQGFRTAESAKALVVDFIPLDGKSFHSRTIDEDTIKAMFMNNRAAELMADKKLDDAYWWARNMLAEHPGHLNGYNTLGVVYQHAGNFVMAEKAFRAGLVREPENLHLIHNLIPILARLGKDGEAQQLKAQLAVIDPTPPFHYFQQGQQAMAQGDFAKAKALFAKEVRRSPFYHEFHFWLGLAELGLGDRIAAREQIARALETSNTKELSQRYAMKLDYLRATNLRPTNLRFDMLPRPDRGG